MQPPSTGALLEPSPQSRIKVNAVHAGHSPPPELLKENISSRLATFCLSQSNNSSIVLPKLLDSETTVATEDGNTRHSATGKLMQPNLRKLTHTTPKTELAYTTHKRLQVLTYLNTRT